MLEINKEYKVLNLYACLGGNRYKWNNCKVTAVELDPELARLYQERFPDDTVIIGDAHQYLLDHYKEFDFIWTSPPCPTHSKLKLSNKNHKKNIPVYPDMKLYEEILFLKYYFNGLYCVENVIPYYEPLIPAKKRGRHLYWTNFQLPSDLGDRKEFLGIFGGRKTNVFEKLCNLHKINLSTYIGNQPKEKIAKNLVDYEAGKTIFEVARNIYKLPKQQQPSLFNT